MNRGLITLATFAALGTTLAVADPTVSTNEAGATTGQPLRTAFYGEVSAWYGRLGFPRQYPGGPDGATLKDLRWSFGFKVMHADSWALRIGPVVDVFVGDSHGAALGVAGQLDWSLGRGWWIGTRGSLAKGDGNGSVATGDGLVMMAGLRARDAAFSLGVDAVRIANDDAAGNGFLVGIGLDGRPGKYGVAASAVGALLVGVVAVLAMSQASTH
ncbi:MAG: hypothetical protein M3619_24495 [Myxococcota bacterium]|nr:hypothetical protein [Myxococcota bacterium]